EHLGGRAAGGLGALTQTPGDLGRGAAEGDGGGRGVGGGLAVRGRGSRGGPDRRSDSDPRDDGRSGVDAGHLSTVALRRGERHHPIDNVPRCGIKQREHHVESHTNPHSGAARDVGRWSHPHEEGVVIVTVTANPAIDRLIGLLEPLERGGVVRSRAAHDDPGGKGINVARVLHANGVAVTAMLPAADDEPLVGALEALGLPRRAVPIQGRLRVNLTLAEDDGTTTKINSPGPRLTEDEAEAFAAAVLDASTAGGWTVHSGSLPPRVPHDWYATVTA